MSPVVGKRWEAPKQKCSGEGCEATVPNHYWGRVTASSAWFFQKDGRAWCPEHLPEWVADWRRLKRGLS